MIEDSNKIEVPFTKDDIKKIKSKRSVSNIAYSIAFIVLGVIIYLFNDSFDVFMKAIFYFLFAITGLVVYDILFGDNSRKDLKNRIKIVTQVKVVSKQLKDFDSDSVTKYVLNFEKTSDIQYYYVSHSIYDRIKVGDIINMEYSKTSLWILKIVWNGINIENKSYIK